jgi:RNA polymerase primary sigma factor
MWEDTGRSPAFAAPGSNNFVGLIASSTNRDIGETANEFQGVSDRKAHGLCEKYRPLARKIARTYKDRLTKKRERGITFDDLCSASLLGLEIASRKFDPTRGVSFAAYARPWIKGEITALFKQDPVAKAVKECEDQQTGDGVDLHKPKYLFLDDTVEIDDEKGCTRHELIEGNRSEDEDAVLAEVGEIGRLRDQLNAVMDVTLDNRERIIFESRFLPDKATTLEEFGTKFGISRERVRQIGAGALRKVQAAAKNKPTVRRSEKQLRKALAESYASTAPRHYILEDWLDAIGKRFPEATMPDRIAAHRQAENLTAEIVEHRQPYHHCRASELWPRVSPAIAHHRANAARLAELRGNKPIRNKKGNHGSPVVFDWERP